ncbi:MAG: dienelactone hydrolase family protein [Verrucomicrobia bacterium]|nr:dienelactone hydrolase family protein [Verrucomicrobiota bacterium]
MKPQSPLGWLIAASLLLPLAIDAQSLVLPGTQPLTMEGDLAAPLVGGIDRSLDRVLADAPKNRARHWNRDLSSPEAYARSVETNRQRLATILGVVDSRAPAQLRASAPLAGDLKGNPAEIGRGKGFRILAVAWNVFRGVQGEGLLLEPDGEAKASVVAVPDCDSTPEQLAGLQPGLPDSDQFARRLAEEGCRVIVPFLIDRSDTYSGLPGVRKLRQSQRETLWRAAYEMGRTLQGYEVQKVLAAVDWLIAQSAGATPKPRVGVVGYGEGGMIACFAGALDPRIELTVVSGYFVNPSLQDEPIYRNVWSLTDEFGSAEIVGLIAPRRVIWERGNYPLAEYPKPGQPHDGAAPGALRRPSADAAQKELEEGSVWLKDVPGVAEWKLIRGEPTDVINDETLAAIRAGLDLPASVLTTQEKVNATRPAPDNSQRLLRQYSQLLEDTQWLMREAEFTRGAFWKKADRKSAAAFVESAKWYKEYFLNEIVGPIPTASLPANPRTRKVSETDAFTCYEVVLDVHPDVFAYGILVLPKGIKPGEKRPVVICQHGLEGRPRDVADPKIESQYYHAFACRLAERGFVTFAPQNCYIGENRFRQVLRKAQPMKLTLWSFIMRQHEAILDWLAAQDFVDPSRMAFYGLSYGGKTAMRIPQIIDRYCLSICSADYNEWIWKNTSARSSYCYLYWGEYDMPEFNIGKTFNYAELSWLMIPRPFMVERGHDDGVAPDEWVAYEFAKTRRQYDALGLGNKTEIEVFNGPHSINGKGTFDFLHKHLNWPKPR